MRALKAKSAIVVLLLVAIAIGVHACGSDGDSTDTPQIVIQGVVE